MQRPPWTKMSDTQHAEDRHPTLAPRRRGALRHTVRTGGLALSLALLPHVALAAPGNPLLITAVHVDETLNTLMIMGQEFTSGPGLLVVTLGQVGNITTQCQTPAPTSTLITCTLSNGLPTSGDYLLTVSNGNKESQKNSYALTIGAVGPQGPEGLQGPKGETGATGPQGLQGPQGDVGAQGPIGLTGATGPQGLTGAQGPVGPVGPQGPIGLTGATGPQGLTGAQGPVGPVGAQGPIGLTGATGPQGLTGAQGPVGPVGPTGAQGPSGVIATLYADGPVHSPLVDPPVATYAFIGPTVSVTIAAGNIIHVASTATLGSTMAGGATLSRFSACHQPSGGGALVDNGSDWSRIRVPQNTRLPMAVSQLIAGLAAGTYNVGVCYQAAAGEGATWNDNDWVTNRVFVTQ